MECTSTDCTKKAVAKGMCQAHYRKQRRAEGKDTKGTVQAVQSVHVQSTDSEADILRERLNKTDKVIGLLYNRIKKLEAARSVDIEEIEELRKRLKRVGL